MARAISKAGEKGTVKIRNLGKCFQSTSVNEHDDLVDVDLQDAAGGDGRGAEADPAWVEGTAVAGNLNEI